MAAGGGPCIRLASRILKDRSKPWQGTARARFLRVMAESRIFRNLLSAMKHVGILALAVPCHGLERSFRILLASGIQGPPPAAILPLTARGQLNSRGLDFQYVTEN